MTGTDSMVPTDELTADDQAALGWAVSIEHPVGAAVVQRVRGGGPGGRRRELAAIRADWDGAGRPLPRRHVHRTPVTFDDGTAVVAVSFAEDDPYGREHEPSFGLYLDGRWDPPWPHAKLDWPDFGVPADVVGVRAALADFLRRARQRSVVEVGCLGGHGRTGTALACLAILTGTPADEAVGWVRVNYCDKAIETNEQADFVAAFSASP